MEGEDDSYPIGAPLDINRYKIPYSNYCMFCESPKDICYMHQIADTCYAFISCSKLECNIAAEYHVETFETDVLHHIETLKTTGTLDKQ